MSTTRYSRLSPSATLRLQLRGEFFNFFNPHAALEPGRHGNESNVRCDHVREGAENRPGCASFELLSDLREVKTVQARLAWCLWLTLTPLAWAAETLPYITATRGSRQQCVIAPCIRGRTDNMTTGSGLQRKL